MSARTRAILGFFLSAFPPSRLPAFLSAFSALSVLSVLSCARIEPPPGGPADTQAPRVLAIFPDSLASLPGFDKDVVFTFNEVVSEGGSPSQGFGTGDLERLVMLSPSENVPVVSWKRNRITVRPREGWRPNTVYRVELQPGLNDLRNNRSSQGAAVTFTTGAPVPDYTLVGKVWDWTTSQPGRAVMLEAILQPDSLVYRSATDSAGSFTFGPLPRGDYLVLAVVDQNRDRKRGGREMFDSVRVTADSGARAIVPELWMFQRDSLPPRLQPPVQLDSLSLSLQFNQKLDPKQVLDSTMVRVWRLPDTTEVPVVAVLPAPKFDSVFRAPRAVAPPAADADSARADTAGVERPDSAHVDSLDRPDRLDRPLIAPGRQVAPMGSRPPLTDKFSVRLAEPLVPGTSYTVLALRVRNASGVASDSSRAGFKLPERPKPTAHDSLMMLRSAIDSALQAGDSVTVDSLRKLLPDSLQALPVDSLLDRPLPPGPPPRGNRPGPANEPQRPPANEPQRPPAPATPRR